MELHAIQRMSWKKFFLTLRTLILSNPPDRPFPTVMMVGDTGIGKNTNVGNFCVSLDLPATIVNLSGAEPSDIQGMPYHKDGVGRWSLPYWFFEADKKISGRKVQWMIDLFKDIPKDRMPTRIILMDELVRVHADAFNPIMNFILDHVLHGQKMEGRPLILAAGNMNTSDSHDFQVNELDAAQRLRLRWVEIRPNFEEWSENAALEKVHESVISYLSKNQKAVRVWNKDNKGIDLRTMTEMGIRLALISNEELMENGESFIRLWVPPEIAAPLVAEIKASVEEIKAEQVALEYPRIKKKVQKLVKAQHFDRINHIITALPDLLKAFDEQFELAAKDKATEKEVVKELNETLAAASDNICDFVQDIPREIAFSFSKEIAERVAGSIAITSFFDMATARDDYFNMIKGFGDLKEKAKKSKEKAEAGAQK